MEKFFQQNHTHARMHSNFLLCHSFSNILFIFIVLFLFLISKAANASCDPTTGLITDSNGQLILGDPSCPIIGHTAIVDTGATVSGLNGIIAGNDNLPWAVTNNGSITAVETGIAMNAGGSVINNGTIVSTAGTGITMNAVGSITNAGSITAVGNGITMNAGGSVVNTGTIVSTNGRGIFSNNTAPITLTNSGTITSTNNSGVTLYGGGTVINQVGGVIHGGFIGLDLSSINGGPSPSGGPSYVDNAGMIVSSDMGFNDGILFGMGGTLLNRATGSVYGAIAVVFDAPGTVDNFGLIGGMNPMNLVLSSTAIGLGAGGTVTNEVGGRIIGESRGIDVSGGFATINNSGTIASPFARAISMSAGGTVHNYASGEITAGSRAIFIDGGIGTVINDGFIQGDETAGGFDTIELHVANSSVINTGTIMGNTQFFAPDGTFTLNHGTVNGNIEFFGANNTLVINGGKLNGIFSIGDGGNEHLVLQNVTNASIGTVTSFDGGTGGSNTLDFINSHYSGGSNFTNWGTANLTANTNLTLTSNLTLGDAAQTGTLNIDASSMLTAQSGLNTIIQSIGASPVLVNNAGTLNVASAAANNSLTIIGNYVGQSGYLNLNAVLSAGQHADELIIDGQNGGGSATGKTFINVHNIGGNGITTSGNGILVVDAIGNATTNADAFALGTPVRNGIYDYRLFRGGLDPNDASTSQDWFLRSSSLALGCFVGPELSVYGSVMPTVMEVQRVTVGTLHERVGEESDLLTRGNISSRNVFNGFWVRGIEQNYHENYSSLVNPSVHGNIAGAQLGLDVYRNLTKSGNLDFAGFYVAYASDNPEVDGIITNSDCTANVAQHTGKIKLNSEVGGLYWTHFWSKGTYLDFVAQGSVYNGNAYSNRASISLHGKGLEGSAEFGYPVQFAKQWTFEPQAQMSYQYASMNDTHDIASNIGFDNGQDLLGRIGARLKYTTKIGNRLLEPYVRANLWSILSGNDGRVWFNEDSIRTSAKSNWVQLGGGLTLNVTKICSVYLYADDLTGLNSHQHSLHGVDAGLGVRINL